MSSNNRWHFIGFHPGLWTNHAISACPSGPMDDLSHRLANALVGNDEGAAALELTLTGPTIKFHTPGVVAVCGAEADVTGGQQRLCQSAVQLCTVESSAA